MSDDLSIPNPGYRGNRAGRYGTGPGRVRAGMDPDTRRLMLFAGGLGAVLVLLISASGLIGHRSTAVPVITADTQPIRVKPDNPGGMKIDGAENDVFSGGSDTADARLAPPAENPDARALRAAEASSSPVTLAPSRTTAIPQPPEIQPTIASPPVASPPVASPPVAGAAADPAARTVPAPPAKPRAATEAHPSVSGHQTASSGHETMVQLAALTSEDAARHEWQQLSKRMPDLLSGRQPVYARTERDGHTFWRVRTAGFTDIAQARTFCDRVREKGGACSVADF